MLGPSLIKIAVHTSTILAVEIGTLLTNRVALRPNTALAASASTGREAMVAVAGQRS